METFYNTFLVVMTQGRCEREERGGGGGRQQERLENNKSQQQQREAVTVHPGKKNIPSFFNLQSSFFLFCILNFTWTELYL